MSPKVYIFQNGQKYDNGDMMDLIKVVFYTVFMYFYLIFIIRVMGKREVGSLSVFDLAVYLFVYSFVRYYFGVEGLFRSKGYLGK